MDLENKSCHLRSSVLMVIWFASFTLFAAGGEAQMAGILPPSVFTYGGHTPAVMIQTNSVYDTGPSSYPKYEHNMIRVAGNPIKNKLAMGFDYRQTRLGSETLTLDGGTKVGSNLESLQFNGSYSLKGADNSDWSFSLGYGSQSDELFKRSSDNTVVASFVTVRPGDKSRWIYGAFFNSNMNIGAFPLPIVAYLYRPSRTLSLVLGMPFVNLRWGSFVGSSLFLLATPGNAQLQFSQALVGPFAFNVGADWQTENFQHFNRRDEDSQFFIERQSVYLGFRGPVYKGVMLDMRYGYRANSKFFQAEGLFDDPVEEFDLEDSAFFSASLRARF